MLQNILQHVPAIPQAQVVEQRAHYHRMARIADRAVIERTDRPLEGITKSSEPARSVECLIGHAIEGKLLPFLQRLRLSAYAIHDRVARLTIFVYDAIRAPGQVIVQRIRWILRERPNPQLDAVQHLEALRHIKGDDRHEARSEPALGNEGLAGINGQLPHTPRPRDILR